MPGRAAALPHGGAVSWARLLGGALLVAAGALFGYDRTAALKRRLALLRELDAGLGLLADELTALRAPLPTIFARERDRPFFSLLHAGFGTEPTERLWRRAAETLDLDVADRAALKSLADVVGRYEAERQANEIGRVRRRLEASAAALEAELHSGRARTFVGLGASFGAILAVLLF